MVKTVTVGFGWSVASGVAFASLEERAAGAVPRVKPEEGLRIVTFVVLPSIVNVAVLPSAATVALVCIRH